MKSILEAAEVEVGAIKRRTIRSFAVGDIRQDDCNTIIGHLDDVLECVRVIKERKGSDD